MRIKNQSIKNGLKKVGANQQEKKRKEGKGHEPNRTVKKGEGPIQVNAPIKLRWNMVLKTTTIVKTNIKMQR